MITSTGTPSSRPHAPQSQPQASTPTKMATGFIRLARLVSQGVSRKPSMPLMAAEMPATSSAMSSVPNCMKPTSAEPPVMSTAPM